MVIINKAKQIYKITNTINGKIYIGQSNNPKSRFNQHMNKNSSSKSISEDVDKYGIEAFTLEIIEDVLEDFQKSESFWIKKYKDEKYELYNKTKGGEEPPTRYGFDNQFTLYTEEQQKEVIDLLLNTNYNYTQIGKITNTSRDFAKRTNDGVRSTIYNKDINFPIRKETHFEKVARSIIYDLKNTSLTQRKIASKYGVARSMVTMINIGENRHDENEVYPIIECGVYNLTSKQLEEISKKLKEGYNPFQISNKFGYGHYQIILKMSKTINSKGSIL